MEEKNVIENLCLNFSNMAAILNLVSIQYQQNTCTDQFEIRRVDWAHEGEEPYRKWTSPLFQYGRHGSHLEFGFRSITGERLHRSI